MERFHSVPPVLKAGESREAWESRREELLHCIAANEYGFRPDMPYTVSWEEENEETLPDGTGIRRIVNITVKTDLGSYSYPLYVVRPAKAEKAPTVLLICSQSRVVKPRQLPPGFSPDQIPEMMKQMGIIMDGPMDMGSPQALDMNVDLDNGHWPVPAVISRGFAMAGFYATDAEPYGACFPGGLAEIFGTKQERRADEWGILAVWAFAAQCAMDYLVQADHIDADHIAVAGHSRCGKAALWAGANDTRFFCTMPNNSGCSGAALTRNKHGENLKSINLMMPCWFAPNYGKFVNDVDALPFDQHMLLAAVAPRALYVTGGSDDHWADPPGEHASAVLSSPVFELYGDAPLPPEMPEPNGVVHAGRLGYHLRKGPHLLAEFDWMGLLDHMERNM